jgi:hypothetical protein
MRFAQVWTFRDGVVARMEIYADRAEALAGAGLREWGRPLWTKKR